MLRVDRYSHKNTHAGALSSCLLCVAALRVSYWESVTVPAVFICRGIKGGVYSLVAAMCTEDSFLDSKVVLIRTKFFLFPFPSSPLKLCPKGCYYLVLIDAAQGRQNQLLIIARSIPRLQYRSACPPFPWYREIRRHTL